MVSGAAIPDYEIIYPLNVASTAFSPSGPPTTSPKLPAYLADESLPLAGLITGQGEIESLEHGGGFERIRVQVETPVVVQFYTYWYPGWKAEANGQPIAIRADGPNALITLDLPPGDHDVSIRFANTPLRTVAAFLSIAALIIAILLLWSPSRLHLRRN